MFFNSLEEAITLKFEESANSLIVIFIPITLFIGDKSALLSFLIAG